MKKLFTYLLSAIMVIAVGCTEGVDDSAIWDKFNSLEDRVAALEQLCKEMNANISSLSDIVKALQNNDYVTNVAPITEDGKVIGYVIIFSKSGAVTIYHGKDGANGTDGKDGQDGKDGVDGYTPVIGVAKDADGVYYWTLDGDWLFDKDGNKVKTDGIDGEDGVDGADGQDGTDGADGKDGITPRLKIENGYWFISYDNGSTWQELGKAVGENGADGDSIFRSVDTTNGDYVIFTLADGTELSLPRHKNISITFDTSEAVACMPSTSVKIGYTLIGADEGTTIETVGDGGWKSTVTKNDFTSGYITVTAPYSGGDGKVLVFANTSNGFTAMKAICFEEGVITDINDVYQAGYEATILEVALCTNLKYFINIPKDAQSWISVADTRAEMRSETLTLSIADNYNNPARSAVVELVSECGDLLQSFVIMQEANVIKFADGTVKSICVAKFDTNGDGELSPKEAAAVTELDSDIFKDLYHQQFDVYDDSLVLGYYNTEISSFDELAYFTGLTTIPSNLFNNCISLESVTIPESVTEICDYAFYKCRRLESIVIPEGVKKIGYAAFSGCSIVENVVVPASVASIGDFVFESCSALKSVVISEGVEELGRSVFYYCTSLESITIPESVTSMGDYVFEGCSGLKSAVISEGITKIGKSLFYKCSSLESVTIPDSVTTMGDYVFYGCSSLKNVNIPEGVSEIGKSTFCDCIALESIVFPKRLTAIKYCAFYGCSSLKSIDIPAGVTDIEDGAFYECSSLESVVIPGSVTNMGKSVFCYSGLKSVVIFEGVTEIGYGAFAECHSLKSVVIPASVTVIGELAFYECSSLESVVIPGNVTEIGYAVFAECHSLKSVVIPASVTVIGELAFYRCSGLENITIPESVVTIGKYAFEECSSLSAFYGKYASADNRCLIIDGALCYFAPANLKTYTIPEGVTDIAEDAFYQCLGLESVVIPDSVTSIGDYAFYGCSSLTSVYCKVTTPPALGADVFNNNASGRKIYVPTASVDAYKAANYWKDYADDIEPYNF